MAWDWVTFGVCVGAVVPSILLMGIFLRYILKNSDRRCFKDSSEDCEILISTTTRARPLSVVEMLHETTHRHLIIPNSPSSSSLIRSSDPPPEYAHQHLSLTENFGSEISLLPPVYGSSSNEAVALPIYGTIPTVSSSIPLNINAIITSLDLLPEFLQLPPPPTYDETFRPAGNTTHLQQTTVTRVVS